MNDLQDKEQEDELKRYWQESTISARNSALVRELSAKVTQFDRKIFWRNFREYAAGLVLVVWAGYGAFKGNRPSIGMVVGVVFVMAYLSWQHRKLRPLDPSADVGAYRKALVERFDDQIRLLSRVKYWYLLPLYLPVVWMTVERWPRGPWSAGIGLALVTALYAFIGWLNESWGVRKLQEARATVKAMSEEEQGT
jgi:hypothetical protein